MRMRFKLLNLRANLHTKTTSETLKLAECDGKKWKVCMRFSLHRNLIIGLISLIARKQ